MPTRDDNGGHMGYDLHWIDGPAPGDAPDEYNRRAHLHVSEPMMAALRQEMERQRMIGDQAGRSLVGEWEEKLSESGQVVDAERASRGAGHRDQRSCAAQSPADVG
jgi:hypothetical protein